MDVQTQIDDLQSRMDSMEQKHPDITMTKPGMIHGILRFAPFMLGTAIISGIVAYIISNSYRKQST